MSPSAVSGELHKLLDKRRWGWLVVRKTKEFEERNSGWRKVGEWGDIRIYPHRHLVTYKFQTQLYKRAKIKVFTEDSGLSGKF